MQDLARVAFLLSLILPSALPASAQARWAAALHIGADRFWGGSVDQSPEHLSFRPYRPTTFAASLDRRGHKVGVGLRLGYASAAMALEGTGAVAGVSDIFTIYSLAPSLSYVVATLGSGNSLLVAAGPLLELWDIADLDSRTRIGGQTSIALAVPLSRRLGATLSGGIAVISSPFDDGELPPEYTLRALWRRSLAGGLEYRF